MLSTLRVSTLIFSLSLLAGPAAFGDEEYNYGVVTANSATTESENESNGARKVGPHYRGPDSNFPSPSPYPTSSPTPTPTPSPTPAPEDDDDQKSKERATCKGEKAEGACWYATTGATCESFCANHGGYDKISHEFHNNDLGACREIFNIVNVITSFRYLSLSNGNKVSYWARYRYGGRDGQSEDGRLAVPDGNTVCSLVKPDKNHDQRTFGFELKGNSQVVRRACACNN